MDDRLDALADRARAIGAWRSPPSAVVTRVMESAASRPASSGPASGVVAEDVAVGDGARAGAPATFARSPGSSRSPWSGGTERTACWTWPGGEIALRVEAGTALGSWIVRGLVWARGADLGGLALDWVCGDHVLTTLELANGVPFQVEEITGPDWHLELRLPDGNAFVLGPPPPDVP